jgi:hypothetical protein
MEIHPYQKASTKKDSRKRETLFIHILSTVACKAFYNPSSEIKLLFIASPSLPHMENIPRTLLP